MLVISRKVGERILIGDQITLTVVKLSSGGVRLGIKAPPELAIVREELAESLLSAEQETIDAAADRATIPITEARSSPER